MSAREQRLIAAVNRHLHWRHSIDERDLDATLRAALECYSANEIFAADHGIVHRNGQMYENEFDPHPLLRVGAKP